MRPLSSLSVPQKSIARTARLSAAYGFLFMADKTYKHVKNLWNDAEASKLSPADQLVYRSNKLGSDQRITNTGGGNTSSKVMETDPLTGEQIEVLWVKGSGGDLRTSTRDNFSSLYQI